MSPPPCPQGHSERYKNGQCAPCSRTCSAKWKLQNPGKVRAKYERYMATPAIAEKRRANSRKHARKGWAPGEHERAEKLRPFVTACACCGTTDPRNKNGWFADHDHSTGMFRDFLCWACNYMVGFVEKYKMDCGPAVATYLTHFSRGLICLTA